MKINSSGIHNVFKKIFGGGSQFDNMKSRMNDEYFKQHSMKELSEMIEEVQIMLKKMY